MKAIKNWEYLQVVCKDQNEVLKALCNYPRYSHMQQWKWVEFILFFKASE